MDFSFNLTQVFSVFVTLFALIDVLGSVPIFLGFRQQGRDIYPFKYSLYSFIILVVFLFIGEWLLKLFGVDLSAFAVAGGVILFVIAMEMVFGIEIFKNDSPDGNSTFVPVVFPLIAGPAAFTTLLTMRSGISTLNIILGIFLNMVVVFLVLKYLDKIPKIIGEGGVYIARKFFGIILMAISVGTISANILKLIASVD